MAYIIGQIFGLLTIVCSLILPFMKKKWQLLSTNIAINGLVILNLVLIGQFGSGCYLCMVAIVQSGLALLRTKSDKQVGILETILFTIAYVGFGFFGIITAPGFVPEINYRNLLELLPICGALSQMICVFVRDEQATRRWILATSLFWLVYSTAIGSSVAFNDLLSVISTVSALYKYRKKKA